MRSIVRQLYLAPLVFAACATGAAAADHAAAAVACKPTSVWLAYDCTIKLTNATTGAPLQKAQLTVGADMPTKPLAEKVAPVAAKATATPGEYHAIVVLDVHGDWALRIKVSGAVRDQLVEILNFGPVTVGPPKNKIVDPAPPPKPSKKR